jgi:microcystin-dependent protein
VAEPFLGEIRMVGFGFSPRGYAFCDGQLLSIAQNTALFSLLGTTYGGDGRTTFALPDLRGRAPLHAGNENPLGTKAGLESLTLIAPEMPQHDHVVSASAEAAGSTTPQGNVLAKKPRFGANVYGPPTSLTALSSGSVAPVGGSQPHTNMQPFLAVGFVIAMQGVFPSRN